MKENNNDNNNVSANKQTADTQTDCRHANRPQTRKPTAAQRRDGKLAFQANTMMTL